METHLPSILPLKDWEKAKRGVAHLLISLLLVFSGKAAASFHRLPVSTSFAEETIASAPAGETSAAAASRAGRMSFQPAVRFVRAFSRGVWHPGHDGPAQLPLRIWLPVWGMPESLDQNEFHSAQPLFASVFIPRGPPRK